MCRTLCVQPYFYTPLSSLTAVGYTGDANVTKARNMNGIISGFSLEPNSLMNGGNYFNWDSKYGSFSYRMKNYQDAKAADGKDIKLWNYVCGNEVAYTYCNNIIENTGLQTELMFWQTMQSGATGYLYYGANLWDENSSMCVAQGSSVAYDGSLVSDLWRVNRYEIAKDNTVYNVYGNGVLLYGKDIKVALRIANTSDPLGTVRVEQMRDGIEDYEMLYMYRDAYGEAAMDTLIGKVSTSVIKYLSMPGFNRSAYPSSMTNEDVFAAVRKELGDALESVPSEHPHEHTWDNGVVTTEPTYKTQGVRTYTCTVCGDTYTESVPVIPPMIGDVNGDRVLNVKDIQLLKKFVASTVTINEIVDVNSDIDGDGTIGVKDLRALKSMLAGN